MITGSSPLSIGTNSHSPANLPSCVTMDGAPPSGWFAGLNAACEALAANCLPGLPLPANPLEGLIS